jgi:hypothetical protein
LPSQRMRIQQWQRTGPGKRSSYREKGMSSLYYAVMRCLPSASGAGKTESVSIFANLNFSIVMKASPSYRPSSSCVTLRR